VQDVEGHERGENGPATTVESRPLPKAVPKSGEIRQAVGAEADELAIENERSRDDAIWLYLRELVRAASPRP
jgi:hypothetical protein